jgi:hypothetical protein
MCHCFDSCAAGTPLQVLSGLTAYTNHPAWCVTQSVCLHTQVALVVLLVMLACALASNAPQPHARKLAATNNVIAAPDTRDGNFDCSTVQVFPASRCERTEAATCTSDTLPEGACCNKELCLILDSDILADAKCADYGACCPRAA